jgi:hypothetical protein
MKKNIFIPMLLAITCITILLSCKKSTTTNNSIVGFWEVTTAHSVETNSNTSPSVITIEDTTYTHNLSIMWNFGANDRASTADYSVNPLVNALFPFGGTYVLLDDSTLTFFQDSLIYDTVDGVPILTAASIINAKGTTVPYSLSGNHLSLTYTTADAPLDTTITTQYLTRQ